MKNQYPFSAVVAGGISSKAVVSVRCSVSLVRKHILNIGGAEWIDSLGVDLPEGEVNLIGGYVSGQGDSLVYSDVSIWSKEVCPLRSLKQVEEQLRAAKTMWRHVAPT